MAGLLAVVVSCGTVSGAERTCGPGRAMMKLGKIPQVVVVKYRTYDMY